MQGILTKSDTLAALAGKISGILKCVEGSFTAEAMAYLEQYLTAEKSSRFLEAVRKLERELGDKMSRLDTAKAKRIVESLDDGKSVDDVVAELKKWCEGGGKTIGNPYDLQPTHSRTLSEKRMDKLTEDIRNNGISKTIKCVEYNGKKYVVDGHHRLIAVKKLGMKEIPIEKVDLPYEGYRTVEDLLWID